MQRNFGLRLWDFMASGSAEPCVTKFWCRSRRLREGYWCRVRCCAKSEVVDVGFDIGVKVAVQIKAEDL